MQQTDAQLKRNHCPSIYATFIFIFRHISSAYLRFALLIKQTKRQRYASTLRSYINRRLHLNCASNPVQPTDTVRVGARARARARQSRPDTAKLRFRVSSLSRAQCETTARREWTSFFSRLEIIAVKDAAVTRKKRSRETERQRERERITYR